MKKRVIALLLTVTVSLTNGMITFAAEEHVEGTIDIMAMEEAVGENTQPKAEEDTEEEELEEVAEDASAENETVAVTNTDMVEKTEESIATTTSESTENITVETPEDVPEQGTATSGNYGVNMGDNIKWTFDEKTGTLTLYGNGEMYDLPDSEYAPWYSLKKDIKKIVVGNGITSIGTDAFYNMVQATDIDIPESVTVIKECALQGCESIKEVHLPDTIIAIGTNAFQFMNSCE